VEDYEAVCVAVVRDLTPAQAVRKLTGGVARRFASRARAEDWSYRGNDYDRDTIAAGRLHGWTFLWEDFGYKCSLPEAAARTSSDRRFASVYWDINATERFTYAIDGRVRRQFDPVLDRRRTGEGRRLAAEAGLRWWHRPEISMLRLQSRLTGLPVATPSWLDRPGVQFWGTRL
jgi:hypothetical protein